MSEKKTFKLEKLVRDDIVRKHEEQGAEVVHHILSPEEKRIALVKKIGEELSEFLSSGEAGELADAQAALDQLIKDAGLTSKQIRDEQQRKLEKNGGFEKGDYIEQETWPLEHKWARYYTSDPERFPEKK